MAQLAEKDLAYYICILIKRKKQIALIMLFFLAVSLMAVYIMPKVYESEAIVQAGVLGGEILSREDMEKYIFSDEFAKAMSLEQVSNNVKLTFTPGYLRIRMRYNDQEKAKLFCARIAE